MKNQITKNPEVTKFLDDLDHPLRPEIEELRRIILGAVGGISENIKWNGPNYCISNEDRITMRVQPPKQIQLIFHRGVKKLTQPKNRLIAVGAELLTWKENDRAVASFKNMNDLRKSESELVSVINAWSRATTQTG